MPKPAQSFAKRNYFGQRLGGFHLSPFITMVQGRAESCRIRAKAWMIVGWAGPPVSQLHCDPVVVLL